MKKFFLVSTALAMLGAGSAMAADMAVKAPIVAPLPACANFGGFYLGGNVGWAYHEHSWVDRDAWVDNFSRDWALGTVNTSRDGVIGGGQVGYNWQPHCALFGIELDGSWASIKSTKYYSPVDANDVGTVLTLNDNLKWFSTLRGRTGIVVDNLLLYTTGGFAYAKINHTWTVTDPNTNPTAESFTASSGRWGWVGGVGAEWALSSNWSLKSEVLYARFTERTTNGISANGPGPVNFDTQDSLWVTRIGVNYRFGGYAPLARY